MTALPRSGRGGRRAAGALLAWVAAGAPAAASGSIRVAIPEFQIEGESASSLTMPLQDGFILGLLRSGVHVIDPMDVARGLESSPELKVCDSSPCLKNIGQLLDVQYVVRVKVEVIGNSYKMSARTFSTAGPAPAALPLDSNSTACDVCTINEARDAMLRLADAVKGRFEEPQPPRPPPPPAPPPPAPSPAGSLAAMMAGSIAIAGGLALLVSLSRCDRTTAGDCDERRAESALAGGLIGVGLSAATVGTWFLIYSQGARSVAAGVTLRF